MLIFSFISPDDSIVAFWKMEETEEQLRKMCSLTDYDNQIIGKCTATKRRVELLSVRALLKAVGIDQTIHYDDRKPCIDGGYISISHSSNIAAIIWNKHHAVGIDIETISERIRRIATRAFCEEEIAMADDDIEKLTVLWNCKECVFKLANDEGIDFREMINIQFSELRLLSLSKYRRVEISGSEDSKGPREGLIEATLTKSGETQHFSLSAMKIEGNTVVWGRKK